MSGCNNDTGIGLICKRWCKEIEGDIIITFW